MTEKPRIFSQDSLFEALSLILIAGLFASVVWAGAVVIGEMMGPHPLACVSPGPQTIPGC